MRFYRRVMIALLVLALPLGGARADTNARPDVISRAPARITKNSAVLRGTIYSDAPLTDYGFEYGEVGNVRRVSLMSVNASPSQDIEYEVKDLKPETAYQAHIYAANANGVAYGEFLSFTTEKAGSPPALEQGEPLLDTDPDIFYIRIPFTSEQPLQTYSVLYGEKKNSVKTKAKCVIDGEFIVATITGMRSDMQIYYQARAKNMYGETVGEVIAVVLPALTPAPSSEPTPTPAPASTPSPPAEPESTPDVTPPGEDDASAQEALPEDTEPEDVLAQSVGLAVRRAFFLPVARVSLMETLELARQADGGDMEVLLAGALEDMSAGQYADALDKLRVALERQADHVDALLLTGLVYLRVDQPELAAAAFEKAQAAAPVDGYAAAGLSLSMLAKGDSGQAYEIALECEKMDPNDPALRIPRILAVLAMERYADLLALAKSVEAQFDGHALALGAKRAALQALGRPEAEQAREALAALPQYTQEESYAKAAAYAVAGDAVTAAALLRQAGIADATVLARCDGAFVRVRNHLTIMLWTRDYYRMFTCLLIADGAVLLLILVISVAGRPRRMHMWEMKQ